MTMLGTLVGWVQRRLGGRVWTDEEVILALQSAYDEIAMTLPVFWDMTYLENLPQGFSYTQPWEKAYVDAMGGFDYGCANFTAEVDRRAVGDERARIGPANHTSPFEATDLWLSRVHASTAISATADVPTTLTAISRVTWDNRGIDALQARRTMRDDTRYQVTKGEVYGFIWQLDGIRTVRKVRVPSAQADTVTVTGSWGLLRRPTDLSTETVTGTWGIPRRIPGHHPIGPELFGAPRRPFLEGKNVRVEHTRLGRAMVEPTDICELPDRYALYLRDYAQARCLERAGPGQDLALAAHFDQRWARGLARITRRLQVVDAERVSVLGGTGRSSVGRPPRPSRPWAYGSVVR